LIIGYEYQIKRRLILLFETVEIALSSMIDDLAQKDGISRKAALLKCEALMNSLTKEYYSGKAPAIAYEAPSMRWGYMYTHVAANADLLVYSLNKYTKNEAFLKKLNSEEMNICVIGGAPGSEILAFSKFYSTFENEEQICLSFSQIDRIVGWSENIQVLKNSVHTQYKKKFGKKSKWPATIDSNFVPLDVTKNNSFTNVAHIFKCDVAVMCYVISEVFDFKQFSPLLEAVKLGHKKNAFVIIVDRSDDETKEKIDKTIKALNGTIVDTFAKSKNLSNDEEKSVLKNAFPEITRSPRVTWNSVSYLVQLK
jgi:Putative SAM-dependent methyltransferase